MGSSKDSIFKGQITRIPGKPDSVDIDIVSQRIGHGALEVATKPRGNRFVWPEGTYVDISPNSRHHYGIPVPLAEIMYSRSQTCGRTQSGRHPVDFVPQCIRQFLLDTRGTHPVLPEKAEEAKADTRVKAIDLSSELGVGCKCICDWAYGNDIKDASTLDEIGTHYTAEDADRIRKHFGALADPKGMATFDCMGCGEGVVIGSDKDAGNNYCRDCCPTGSFGDGFNPSDTPIAPPEFYMPPVEPPVEWQPTTWSNSTKTPAQDEPEDDRHDTRLTAEEVLRRLVVRHGTKALRSGNPRDEERHTRLALDAAAMMRSLTGGDS